MTPNLTVVIPTLNNEQGLKYLTEYFKKKNYRIIVVDNKPSPQKSLLFNKLPKDRFLYLPQSKNLGFAAGVNRGAREVKSQWLLILNDDIEFKNGDIMDDLVGEAKNKKLDALSPRLINPDGTVENYGYKVLPYGKVKLNRNKKDKDIDGLTAACLLVKSQVYKQLNGFDESFFAYLEDVDFFLRFKKQGYKMGMSELAVKHNHMTTSKTMGYFKEKQDMVNWWRLYSKHSEYFKVNLLFLAERARNISGFLKAVLRALS